MSENVAMVMAGPGTPPAPVSRPVPDPGPGEAIVRVRASSLNVNDLVNLTGPDRSRTRHP